MIKINPTPRGVPTFEACLQAGTLLFFAAYLMVFPGATITVALDRVPAWGVAFGGVLLMLQGAAALCWLGGRAGIRGLLAGFAVGALAFAVEYTGVRTGLPFGRYTYTDVLQPQVFGVVPLAICAAWVMVVPSARELARIITPQQWGTRAQLVVTATLILLLDLQIETVATRVNQYWRWLDSGFYYGVPLANFIAWWVVGLGLAWLVDKLIRVREGQDNARLLVGGRWSVAGGRAFIPCALYVLSTLMFAATNLARGYAIAGIIGVGVLLALAAWWLQRRGDRKQETEDRSQKT